MGVDPGDAIPQTLAKEKLSIVMRIRLILALASIVVFALEGRASSPVAPYPFVIAHAGSDHLFVMTPAKGEGKDDMDKGRCYRVTSDGKFEEAWTTSGWWSFPSDMFLSPDGKGLIRFIDVKRVTDANGKLLIGDMPLLLF